MVSFCSTAFLQVDFLHQQLLTVAFLPVHTFLSMLHFSQPSSLCPLPALASHFIPEHLFLFLSLAYPVFISASLIIMPSFSHRGGGKRKRGSFTYPILKLALTRKVMCNKNTHFGSLVRLHTAQLHWNFKGPTEPQGQLIPQQSMCNALRDQISLKTIQKWSQMHRNTYKSCYCQIEKLTQH